MTKVVSKRIASIDILRALTMLLMIWVNDFWTLTDVPKWLEHAKPNEDFLGFSDVIFPLFLFIVGLSIPLAFQNRIAKNESRITMAKHILVRSLSLIFIGVFMVNYETHHESIGLGKWLWCLLMAIAVSLVWMRWKISPIPKNVHPYLKALGWAIFISLFLYYKGGIEGENMMTTQWWGILGLIGWAYSINAITFLITKGRLIIIIVVLLLFNLLSVLSALGTLPKFETPFSMFSTWYTGTIPAFTTAGVLATLIFQKLSKTNFKHALILLSTIGVSFIAIGLITRSIWGISKVPGTPSWLWVCTGIGFISFVLLYYIVDIKKYNSWARFIIPAGTATLTCYLIPYFSYPIRQLTGIELPDFLNHGVIGLMGSFVFALLVVLFTGWLQKKGFTLKL